MKTTEKIILGGGISGLIFAYYNKNYKIITKDVGGQFKSKFQLAPRLLENNFFTRKLLNDLKISYKIKTIKIGYYDSFIKKVTSIKPRNFEYGYYKLSRGVELKSKDSKKTLNKNKNELTILDVDFNLIIDKLQRILKDSIVFDEFKSVDLENKVIVCKNKTYNYSILVNTIPLNFLNVIKISNKPDFVTFIKLKSFDKLEDYEFAYFNEGHFYRVTKADNYFVAEMRGKVKEEKLKKIFGDNYLDFLIAPTQLKVNNIDNKINALEKYNLFCFGRYGRLNKTIKIEDVVKNVLEFRFNKKTCILDIDGVLAKYPDEFIDFVNDEMCRSYDNIFDIKNELDYNTYSMLKEKYRLSGIKAYLSANKNVDKLIKFLNDNDYFKVIISSRPVFKYNVVLKNTLFWLKQNNIDYDFIYWTHKKADNINKFDDVSFIIEDNYEHAKKYSLLGYKVYLLLNKYNKDSKKLKNIIFINDLIEVVKYESNGVENED